MSAGSIFNENSVKNPQKLVSGVVLAPAVQVDKPILVAYIGCHLRALHP